MLELPEGIVRTIWLTDPSEVASYYTFLDLID